MLARSAWRGLLLLRRTRPSGWGFATRNDPSSAPVIQQRPCACLLSPCGVAGPEVRLLSCELFKGGRVQLRDRTSGFPRGAFGSGPFGGLLRACGTETVELALLSCFACRSVSAPVAAVDVTDLHELRRPSGLARPLARLEGSMRNLRVSPAAQKNVSACWHTGTGLMLREIRFALWSVPVSGLAALPGHLLGSTRLPTTGQCAASSLRASLAQAGLVALRRRHVCFDRLEEALPVRGASK